MRSCSTARSEGSRPMERKSTGRFLPLARGQQLGHRPAGQAIDLHGALQALAVGRVQPCCGQRVKKGQFRVQCRPALGGGFAVDFGTQRGVGLRQVGQPMQQGAEIKHRPADQQRHLAGRGDLGHRRQRVGAETGGGIAFFRRNEVDQAVRVTCQRVAVRFGGADIHVAENLRRIDTDQFDGKTVSQRHGDRRLARGGRTHEQDGGRQAGRIHGGECYHARRRL